MADPADTDASDNHDALRQAVATAAWNLLTETDALARLGLSPSALSKQVAFEAGRATEDVHPNSVAHHIKSGNIVRDMAARVANEISITGSENSGDYQVQAKVLGDLRGKSVTEIAKTARHALGTVLRLDLEDGKHAERIWYLLLAIADMRPEALGKKPVDLRSLLAEGHDRNQLAYEAAYDLFCDLTGRRYAVDRGCTMRSINAYLEGVLVQARYGRGPSQQQDEVTDTVMRIFWAHTCPLNGPAADIDFELFDPVASKPNT